MASTTYKVSKIFTAQPEHMTAEQLARLELIQNVKTTPRDERFPSTNQALHCWNRYNEWVVCLMNNNDDESKCKSMRQLADSICPSFWLNDWDEQRDNGTFSGVGSRFDQKPTGGGHH
jgi:cytochrome c oxidase subunit 6b